MSDETKVEDAEAPAGMAALGALTEEGVLPKRLPPHRLSQKLIIWVVPTRPAAAKTLPPVYG